MLPPQQLDDLALLAKGLFKSVRQGKPGQFLKSQNAGFLGGWAKGLTDEVRGAAKANTSMKAAWGRGLLGGVRDGKVVGGLPQALRELKGAPKVAWEWSFGAMWPALGAMAAYHAVKAPKGEKLGTFAGRMTGDLTGAALGAAVLGMPGAFFGTFLLGGRVSEGVTNLVSRSQRYVQKKASLEMGGNFYDFGAARTMRQVAAQEMSTSLLNARSYLGSEAAFMHQ